MKLFETYRVTAFEGSPKHSPFIGIKRFSDQLFIPAGNIKGEMIRDIGQKTTENYVSEIKKADAVIMKEPMGAFVRYLSGEELPAVRH